MRVDLHGLFPTCQDKIEETVYNNASVFFACNSRQIPIFHR